MAQDDKPRKVDYHGLKKAAEAQAKAMGQKDVRFDVMGDGTFRRIDKGRPSGRFTARELKSGLEARGINDSFLKPRRNRKRKRSNVTNNQGFDFGVFDDNDDFTVGNTGGGGDSASSGVPAGLETKEITICEDGSSSTITVIIEPDSP